MDNGSAVDILYHDTFKKMGLKDRYLKAAVTPLYGFTGDSIIPMGVVTLPITIGEFPINSTVMANFLIVDDPTAFNTILGRPSLKALKAITSIYHLTMKFPTPEGTGTIRRSQLEARECYNQAIRIADRGRKLPQVMVVETTTNVSEQCDIDPRDLDEQSAGPVEKLYEFSVDPSEPTKILKLGQNLDNEVKNKLEEFLKSNTDIFMWEHFDMVGISPEIMS